MKRKSILLSFLCLCIQYAFAQKPNVSVDPVTGTGNVVIPLYTVGSGQVNVPVSLVYTARGVKPKDVEGSAGMGWNVVAGGQISREVRGIPDDIMKDNGGNSMLGWMVSVMNGAIAGFHIANNGVCSNETTDISYINTYFTYTKDTEPDIFYVNAPGLSCQIVWEPYSGVFKPLNY